VNIIRSARKNPLRNYIVPGLTSWLVKDRENDNDVCIRMFEMEREFVWQVTPHSHRFDFECVVLEGQVLNTIYVDPEVEMAKHRFYGTEPDLYRQTDLVYLGKPGQYRLGAQIQVSMCIRTSLYEQGQTYRMDADQIHSIRFSKGTQVLFFEGPIKTNKSVYLEPIVNGQTIETMKVEPWMFLKEGER
jgi:hypothetical protein